jgi:NAD-dependent SIR2 family protein deacetylase
MPIKASDFQRWYQEHGGIQSPKCTSCGVRTQEEKTGRRWLEGKPYCSDCYFEELSSELESSPIHSPRVPR